MKAQDTIKLTGRLRIEVRDALGAVKEIREFDNLVVTAGKTFIASRMAGTASAVMGWIAVGTGTVAPASGDTALGAEAARVATTVSGGTPSSNTVQYVSTFGAGTGTGALTEAGIFNAAAVGTMLARVTFSVINKGAADSMTITWTVTVN